MTHRAPWFVVAALLVVALGAASAADQEIVGRLIRVKDPKPGIDPSQRELVGCGRDAGGTATLSGDPAANAGGAITFFVNGGSWTSQTFPLPQGIDPGSGKTFWRATSSGFRYKDARGTNGPVRNVQIRSAGGRFGVKAAVLGKLGPITLLPPNPGVTACVRLDIAGGDSYHVLLPPSPSATIAKNDDRAFVMRNALVSGLCPTSVCGNGIREPGEQCDGGPACSDCTQSIPSCCSAPDQCVAAPLFSLNFYLMQYCSAVFPSSTPIQGGICAPDGSCAPAAIAPVPVCCQLADSCYEITQTTTAGLWTFQNVCRGAQSGTFQIAATCGPAGLCIPQ